MAECIYNLWVTPGFSSVSPTKKKSSKVVKLTENMRNEMKRMKNQFSNFEFLSSSKNVLILTTKTAMS